MVTFGAEAPQAFCVWDVRYLLYSCGGLLTPTIRAYVRIDVTNCVLDSTIEYYIRDIFGLYNYSVAASKLAATLSTRSARRLSSGPKGPTDAAPIYTHRSLRSLPNLKVGV